MKLPAPESTLSEDKAKAHEMMVTWKVKSPALESILLEDKAKTWKVKLPASERTL